MRISLGGAAAAGAAASGPPAAVKKRDSLFQRWWTAAVAASLAECVTFPLDFTKTRMQLYNELGRGDGPVRGMLATARGVLAGEGAMAFYGGLPAAVIRQSVYGGIGVGLYQPVRGLLCGEDVEGAALWRRIAAGCITGGVGQLVATPTDVVKVRLQADGRLKLLGQPTRYRGTFDAFRRIPVEEGVLGLYKGTYPSVARATIINGAGIAAYDHSKHLAMRVTGRADGLWTQTLGAMVSGLVSAVVSSPLDVVKTRIMNQAKGARVYSGLLDCMAKTVRAEGVMSLYKGFLPAYARLGPWQVVFFIVFEELNVRVLGKTL